MLTASNYGTTEKPNWCNISQGAITKDVHKNVYFYNIPLVLFDSTPPSVCGRPLPMFPNKQTHVHFNRDTVQHTTYLRSFCYVINQYGKKNHYTEMTANHTSQRGHRRNKICSLCYNLILNTQTTCREYLRHKNYCVILSALSSS